MNGIPKKTLYLALSLHAISLSPYVTPSHELTLFHSLWLDININFFFSLLFSCLSALLFLNFFLILNLFLSIVILFFICIYSGFIINWLTCFTTTTTNSSFLELVWCSSFQYKVLLVWIWIRVPGIVLLSIVEAWRIRAFENPDAHLYH